MSDTEESSDYPTAENARRNMKRLGIPKGSDDPMLIALGSPPLVSGESDRARAIRLVHRVAELEAENARLRSAAEAWFAAYRNDS